MGSGFSFFPSLCFPSFLSSFSFFFFPFGSPADKNFLFLGDRAARLDSAQPASSLFMGGFFGGGGFFLLSRIWEGMDGCAGLGLSVTSREEPG